MEEKSEIDLWETDRQEMKRWELRYREEEAAAKESESDGEDDKRLFNAACNACHTGDQFEERAARYILARHFNKKPPRETIAELEEKANAGSREALCILGLCVLLLADLHCIVDEADVNSRGVARVEPVWDRGHFQKALSLLRSSAEKDFTPAKYHLGRAYHALIKIISEAVERNMAYYEHAYTWIEVAEAGLFIPQIHHIRRACAKARYWYERAASSGSLPALVGLGDYYSANNFPKEFVLQDEYLSAKSYHIADRVGRTVSEYAYERKYALRIDDEAKGIVSHAEPNKVLEEMADRIEKEKLKKRKQIGLVKKTEKPINDKEKKMIDQTERLETMKAILEKLREDSGVWLCRPVKEGEIEECNKNLVELALPAIPTSGADDSKGLCYGDFLNIHNGFAWNGVELWGCDIVTEAGNERGYRLMDLITMNDDYDERYWENHKQELLYIGRADDDIYVYNVDDKTYEIRNMEEGCSECNRSFDSFSELFDFIIGGRLGWPGCGPFANGDDDDSDEAAYEHDEGRYDGEV
ncbi:hypothetical protein AGMMS50293_13830 [Spirochaetia bacterium]|nr:hypothetical protein AGMMS50293_13830 [Spirochaetia bacterium]